MGLNEVPLGIELPAFVVELARLALPVHRLERAVVSGILSEGPEVEGHGWVEETLPAAALLPRAIELASALGRFSAKAYTHAKHLVRAAAVKRGRASFQQELDGFMTAFGRR